MSSGGASPPPRADEPLRQGWKEIADFFGVTVRTVQLWEAEKGLPVRRMPGERGRVYASEHELHAWRQAGGEAVTPRQAELESSRPRRHPIAAVIILCALLIPGGWFAWRSVRVRQPAVARLEGGVLVALDQSGDVIWRTVVGAEAIAVPPEEGQSGGVQVLDLDANGSREVLLLRRQGGTHPPSDELHCYSARGALMWKWRAGAQLKTAAGESTGGRFAIMLIIPWLAPRSGGVVVVARDVAEYPCQVVLLSPTGQPRRTYWHSGHLNLSAVGDLDRDGRRELWLGGIANSYKQATVVVLDPETMGGASREEKPGYQLAGLGEPREKARVLLYRTELSRGLAPFNRVSQLQAQSDRVVVMTREQVADRAPDASIVYTFGPRGELTGASFASNSISEYQARVVQQLLDPGAYRRDEARLRELRWLRKWDEPGVPAGVPPAVK